MFSEANKLNLNHAFVSIIVVLGLFSILYIYMPAELFNNQPDFVTPVTQNKEIRDTFSAADVVAYSTLGQDNMTYEYSSLFDHPTAPQFNTSIEGTYLEVWWSEAIGVYRGLELRQASRQWWGGYGDIQILEITTVDGETVSHSGVNYINAADLTSEWNGNASVFYCQSDIFDSSIMFTFNETAYTDIADAFDNGELGYLLSFEIDFDAMKPNVYNLVVQLLTFQSPDLGVPGDGGAILNYIFGIGLWAIIALLIFAFVTSVIPFINGWQH